MAATSHLERASRVPVEVQKAACVAWPRLLRPSSRPTTTFTFSPRTLRSRSWPRSSHSSVSVTLRRLLTPAAVRSEDTPPSSQDSEVRRLSSSSFIFFFSSTISSFLFATATATACLLIFSNVF